MKVYRSALAALLILLSAVPAFAQTGGLTALVPDPNNTVRLWAPGQQGPLTLDTAGNLRINCITGCTSGGGGASTVTQGPQGSSASPWFTQQTGSLPAGTNTIGAMNNNATAASAPPTYSAGIQPMSMTLTGGMRVQLQSGGVDVATLPVAQTGALPTGNNVIGAVTQSGGWTVNLGGTLPAFASTPTFNLGTLGGAATAANQVIPTAAGTGGANAASIQGIAGGVPVPISGTITASLGAFAPTGQATLSATTTSSSVALGSAGPTALVTNNGTVTAYINFGVGSATATTSNYPVNAGQTVAFANGSNTYIAGITASGTASLAVTTGTGLPAVAGGGSSGGGGGNTVAATAAGTTATTANPVQGVTGGVPLPISGSVTGTLTDMATANSSAPTYSAGPQTLSQNLSGGLRSQVSLGGTDVAIGQQVMAASVPVALASNQTSLPVTGTISGSVSLSAGTNKVGSVAVLPTVATPTACGGTTSATAGTSTALLAASLWTYHLMLQNNGTAPVLVSFIVAAGTTLTSSTAYTLVAGQTFNNPDTMPSGTRVTVQSTSASQPVMCEYN